MKKTFITLGALVFAFSATVASAQYQYPNSQSPIVCPTVSRNLSYGARGTDVRSVQSFLVAQNYPGSGSWMLTGFFGRATQSAVRIFQSQQGLSQTGVVDFSTRMAIMARCNGGYNPNPYNPNPYNPNPYNAVTITSLTPNIVSSGTMVTIYGTGFDYTNTVYVGSQPITNVTSSGTTLSFTVPSYITGVVQVYVTNSHGTSNTLSLTVNSANPCPQSYPYTYGSYGNCGGCTYQYGSVCSQSPYVSYVSPNSGPVGTVVTLTGTGFSTYGNTVRFSNGSVANLPSYNGTSLSFTVPTQLTGSGLQVVTPGTYSVSVVNAQGMVSNASSFTVTGGSTSGAPVVTGVTGPTNLSIATTGTWLVTVSPQNNSYTTMSVRWGDENQYQGSAAAPQTSYSSQTQTFSFTHAYYQAGTYSVTFTAADANGRTNTSSATVVVSGAASSQAQLYSASPMSGRVGTVVALSGTGFVPSSNTVHFGQGGSANVSSYSNGTQIYYTIPSYTGACDPDAQVCTMQAIQVTPGTYPISVSNINGRTQTLYFTVTQ